MKGRFFITPHAVRQYIARVRDLSFERALGRLIDQCERAHFVKRLDSGAELWRMPRPERARFVVSREHDGAPQVVTVLKPFDGFRGPRAH